MRTNKRIWLEGDSFKVGDTVTFETDPKGADSIRLVIGEKAAYYPPVDPDYDVTKPLSESFTLEKPGTAVAWLMKKNTAVAGTLFWINDAV